MPGFVWLFSLIWIAGVAAFDWMSFTGIYQQASASRYHSAQAIVVEARVIEEAGEDSTSYYPYLQYRYEVSGRPYSGDRYRYGMRQSNRRGARQIVDAHPVGSKLEIWYSPENPAESVVEKNLSGQEAYLVMFLTPFNVAGLGLLFAPLLGLLRRGPGDVVVVREGMGWRARLKYTHPLVSAAAALGGSSFLAAFVVGFACSMEPGLTTMSFVWAGILAFSGWAAFRTAENNRAGTGDLRIEPGRIEYTSGSQRESRPISEVESVEIKQLETRNSDGDLTYSYEVELRLRSGESHSLHQWGSQPEARAFADWLKARLNLE